MHNTAWQLEDLKIISATNIDRCMKCGRCSAACPSYEEMDIKPHQFISYLKRGDVETLLDSDSLWQCLACFACVQRCPRDLKPANLIEAARLLAIRPKGQEHLSADDMVELLDPDMPQQLLVAAFRKYS